MLAIAGGKGGVGKTTAALGLADALPGRPLVVDADRDVPNLHAVAGLDRDQRVVDAGGDPLAAARRPPDLECRVVAGPDGHDVGADSGLDGATDRLLRRLSAAATDGTGERATAEEWTLVDCPAGASPAAVRPLRVADAVVLVSTLCAPALRDTAKTAAMAGALDTPVVGIVLNRTRLCPGRVVDLLDCPVLGTVPEVRPPVLEKPAVREAFGTISGRLAARMGVKTADAGRTPG